MLSTDEQMGVAHLYFEQIRSQRDIARQLGVHRNTAKKYISAMQSWLDDIDESRPAEDTIKRLENAITNAVFTEGKLTDTFLKFVERQPGSVNAKDRMELYQEIRSHYVGTMWNDGETVDVDCGVRYSALCKAIKLIEERTGKALFVKRDKRKRRRGSIWDG
ncbi:hypothetical protein [Alicyclobacillus sp. ALC3]|uniref:hypothetical protein n=1 Tax=Alicyclobacillus sp. ALC3 TaxID=2796143 RepID=UPI0023791E5F|nr:hypothetical protein [Alicyclobacillus sp. ALC3]WDL98496.1 hypothetical protein JC200_07395 [Alicyclobacillus sp. ALC3]